jgi:hypothetical protein
MDNRRDYRDQRSGIRKKVTTGVSYLKHLPPAVDVSHLDVRPFL